MARKGEKEKKERGEEKVEVEVGFSNLSPATSKRPQAITLSLDGGNSFVAPFRARGGEGIERSRARERERAF